ncbi:MAG: magnesium transporter [Verrucomicrobia bacterium]|nr:magnesium transporter [Verrucomicrobiota bacterium]
MMESNVQDQPPVEESARRIERLLEAGHLEEVHAFLRRFHAADVAEILAELETPALVKAFAVMVPHRAADVLDEFDDETYGALLDALGDERLTRILNALPPDEATDVLGTLPRKRAAHLLHAMAPEQRELVRALVRYAPDTAGGIMSSKMVPIAVGMNVGEATRMCRQQFDRHTPGLLFVTDETGRLVGSLRVRDLLFSPEEKPVGSIMAADVPRVRTDTDQEEVGNLFRKYDLLALPVVDEADRLVGVITVDDVLEVIEEEDSEDIHRMAGTAEREPFTEPLWKKAFARLPWLGVTFVGELVLVVFLKMFGTPLQESLVIAAFLPLQVAMAGNVALQISTVLVRGLAVGDIEPHDLFYNMRREVPVALLLGLVFSLLAGTSAGLLAGKSVIGLIIGVAMASAVLIASVNAVLIPLICSRLGIDPAVVSGPFVTVLNDLLGGVIYILVGVLVLSG